MDSPQFGTHGVELLAGGLAFPVGFLGEFQFPIGSDSRKTEIVCFDHHGLLAAAGVG